MEYIFTSSTFIGFMRFAYDADGMIKMFENNATISDEQMNFLCKNFPFTDSDLPKLRGKHGVIEQHIDLTFETFWKKYDYKKSKRNAQIQWGKLSDEVKFLAIAYIPKYRYQCKINATAMLYAERYLKQCRWEDDS